MRNDTMTPLARALVPVLLGIATLLAQQAHAQSSAYRMITVDPAANPFRGPPDLSYGGSKHVMWAWHPIAKRVYSWGGDYGAGAASFGQPDMGATFNAGSGQSYGRDSSLNNDQYSIDPYASGTVRWRLEHPYLPRNINGQREARPGRPDQAALVWDSKRSKFWGIYTVLRTEFLYRLPDGTPDLWANGDMTTSGNIEPTGTWSFAPNPAGGTGTWTFETSARLAYRPSAGGTNYEGNVLVTSAGDERIANWEYDVATDRVVSFGFGKIFIFNPATKTYEHRSFSPSGYNYFNPCSSYVAILGDWMYGVVMARQNDGTRKSLLVRVNIPKMLALANGAAIPSSSDYTEVFTLPWTLSRGGVWEANGDGSAKWQEHAGVMSVSGKVVVVVSYDRLVENGVAKMGTWDPSTRTFSNAPLPPDQNIAANSWVALPDTGEVLFGLNTSGYTNDKLWAYKVGAGVKTPNPPTNVTAN
jgi:hypothetical protein